MSVLIFGNNASSTIAGSITPTSTTVNLSAGTAAIFPQPLAGQEFIATFIDQLTGTKREIVHVTNITPGTDICTIVRSQENTLAQAWTAGDIFAHLHTAGAMQAMMQKTDISSTGIIYAGADTGTVNNIIVSSVEPELDALVNNNIFNITIAQLNTGDTNMTISPSNTAFECFRADGNKLQIGDLTPNQKALFIFTGNSFQLTNYKPSIIKAVFPYDYWAGVFSGTVNAWTASIPAAITYPYSGGLIFSGLTSQANTGAVTMALNQNPPVNLLYQNGAAFVGGEVPTLHTLLMIESDGVNFRTIGIGSGGLGGPTGPTGGPPPGPGFKYGDYESVFLTETSQKQTFPTAYFIPTQNITNQAMSSYGPDWVNIGTWSTAWVLVPIPPGGMPPAGSPNLDTVSTTLYQRGSLTSGTFIYGAIGSIYLEIDILEGTMPAGFVSTFNLTGHNMTDYGPYWQEIMSVTLPMISGSTGVDSYMKAIVYQRVSTAVQGTSAGNSVSSTYGIIGSIYVDIPVIPLGSGFAMPTWASTNFITGLTMGQIGGSWLKIATTSTQEPSYNMAVAPVISFYQRIL